MKNKKSMIPFLAVPVTIGLILAATLLVLVIFGGTITLLNLLAKITFPLVGGFLLTALALSFLMGRPLPDTAFKLVMVTGLILIFAPLVFSDL